MLLLIYVSGAGECVLTAPRVQEPVAVSMANTAMNVIGVVIPVAHAVGKGREKWSATVELMAARLKIVKEKETWRTMES